MQTIGARLSLTFSSLLALLDDKLDSGYKMGYMITCAYHLRVGFVGKPAVVVAMWVGSHLARFAPLPQGALFTLLYMSIKLQSDLS